MCLPKARLARRTVACCTLAFAVATPRAAAAQITVVPSSASFWVGSAATIAAGLLVDVRARDIAQANHTPALDHLAGALDPFGRAGYLVPALAADYLVPLVVRRHRWADAALRVGLGYAVSDGLESVLKPLVGRHRPAATGGALRFHPLSSTDAWFSFPSAHTVHAFSIAAAVSDEARNPWVAGASYGVATLVAAQRVYRQAHWTSDVVASAVLAIATSRTTVHWLAAHGLGRVLPPLGPAP